QRRTVRRQAAVLPGRPRLPRIPAWPRPCRRRHHHTQRPHSARTTAPHRRGSHRPRRVQRPRPAAGTISNTHTHTPHTPPAPNPPSPAARTAPAGCKDPPPQQVPYVTHTHTHTHTHTLSL